MKEGSGATSLQVTVEKDSRITGFGKVARKLRLDELPQLLNIVKGEMSFVGDGDIIGTTKENLDFTRVLAA